jgi:F-type H+-transporting ATPase subunit b
VDPKALVSIAAAEHPLIDIDLTVVLQFILFGVLFFACNKLLFQPYLKLREARRAGIEGAREEADRMTAEADAKLADFEKSLSAARARTAEEGRKVRIEAVAHETEVTSKAKATALAAMNSAQATVKRETETARAELMPQADALARQMASKLLGREVA